MPTSQRTLSQTYPSPNLTHTPKHRCGGHQFAAADNSKQFAESGKHFGLGSLFGAVIAVFGALL